MKSILTIILSFLLVVSGLAQTRNVVVGTNDVIVSPTNFWNANATNGRSGLGLGSAATNPASAFQPSSSVLSNLASNNAINLTNLQASNVVGIMALSNLPSISFSNAVQSFVSDVSNATNTVTNSRNVTVYSISPTVNSITNTVQLTTSNVIAGDLARIIHTGPTNSLTRVRKIGEATNLITLNQASESVDFIYNGTNWLVLPNNAQTTPIYFSGTNVSNNIFTTRANLGFSTNLNALWTATNNTEIYNELDLNAYVIETVTSAGAIADFIANSASANAAYLRDPETDGIAIRYNSLSNPSWIVTNSSEFRAAINLGWSALTNSNAGTRLVSVDNNGSVVSPTNFWQVAPIASNLQTIVQTFAPTTNSTNAATNGRNIYVYSLATNVSGITNTVTLPTNVATIAGDNITVIHQGLTNTTTAIRKLGQTNNLITINKFDEAVKFIYENGDWAFYHNISFVDPIQFSGTNTSINTAISRTNLGLGWTALTNTNVSTGLLGYETNGEIFYNRTNLLAFTNVLKMKGAFIGYNIGNYASSGNHAFQVVQTNSSNGTPMAIAGGSSLVEFWSDYFSPTPNYGGAIGLAKPSEFASSNIVISSFSQYESWTKKIEIFNGIDDPIVFYSPLSFNNNSQYIDKTRTNLKLGASWLTNTNNINFRNAIELGSTNTVTFGQTTISNGGLYVIKTNIGPFEGLANLINSSNTTLSNETLFRVGVAEATNRSAQFGFRTVRTNNGGEGFATFSVYGYNALMMIGPSDRSRTNTATNAAIEADIYSISDTNKVATLIDTNTGAFTLHRPVGFRTNETNGAPVTGTGFNDRTRWLQIYVGTNTLYIPLFQ